MKKQNVLLILFGIIAVFAIMGCEATVSDGGSTGGGNTDPSNQNFLNGTTWSYEYSDGLYSEIGGEVLIDEREYFLQTISFSKSNFTFKTYNKTKNTLFKHLEGTYVYNTKEKKVILTLTSIIEYPDDEATVGSTSEELIIIEEGTIMKYPDAPKYHYYTKQ